MFALRYDSPAVTCSSDKTAENFVTTVKKRQKMVAF
jgi:hypothetical protein